MHVPLRAHNVIDYISAVTLVLAPFLFGFDQLESARNLFLALGLGLAAYSALTRYYYSVFKVIPVGLHMMMDVLSGLTLMMGPWMLSYRDDLTPFQLGLHFVLGFGVLGLVAVTRPLTTTGEGAGVQEDSYRIAG